MIYLSPSNSSLPQKVIEQNKDIILYSNVLEINYSATIIFFKDPYLDDPDIFLDELKRLIDICKTTNSFLIYIDSNHLYGLTEKTKVNISDAHKPISLLGKIREKAYVLLQDSKIKYTIIRFPDLLGKGANIFFNDFFDGKSNFLLWPGSTYINHEFLNIDFAAETIIDIINKKTDYFVKEINITGIKYSIEQLAADINEQTTIPVKINELSYLSLLLKARKDKRFRTVIDNLYLFKKPIFLS